MQLIKMACPANVVLVHGEKAKMYRSPSCEKVLCFTYERDICTVTVFCQGFELTSLSFRASLKQRITREFGISCYDPANGSTVTIHGAPPIPLQLSSSLLKRNLLASFTNGPATPNIEQGNSLCEQQLIIIAQSAHLF